MCQSQMAWHAGTPQLRHLKRHPISQELQEEESSDNHMERKQFNQQRSSQGLVKPVLHALWISGLQLSLGQKVWFPPKSFSFSPKLQIMVQKCNVLLVHTHTSSHIQSSRCVWDSPLGSSSETQHSYQLMIPAEKGIGDHKIVLSIQHLSRVPCIQFYIHGIYLSNSLQSNLSNT